MNADFTGKARGVEELLVKALDQHLGQSLMITTLHLTASQLSHTCAEALENLGIPRLEIFRRPTTKSAWTHYYDYEGPEADASDEEDTDASSEAEETDDDATSD
jgi:precorrin-6x reductase